MAAAETIAKAARSASVPSNSGTRYLVVVYEAYENNFTHRVTATIYAVDHLGNRTKFMMLLRREGWSFELKVLSFQLRFFSILCTKFPFKTLCNLA